MKRFFISCEPPTVTHQEQRIGKRKDGSVYMYEAAELKRVRTELEGMLYKRRPEAPYTCAVRLIVKYGFKATAKHPANTWKTTKPDTDNMNKLLKDVMTKCGFWTDDALVVSEVIEKYYTDLPGIFIQIDEMEGTNG